MLFALGTEETLGQRCEDKCHRPIDSKAWMMRLEPELALQLEVEVLVETLED